MAADLERYLTEKLKEIPKGHPDRRFLDDELVRIRLHLMGITFPEDVLTEEFALRVNRVAGIIPDDVGIGRLRFDRSDRNSIDHELPNWQFSWRTFRTTLYGHEQKQVTVIINSLLRAKVGSMGELRQISLENLSDSKQYTNIGPRRATFTKIAFMKQDY